MQNEQGKVSVPNVEHETNLLSIDKTQIRDDDCVTQPLPGHGATVESFDADDKNVETFVVLEPCYGDMGIREARSALGEGGGVKRDLIRDGLMEPTGRLAAASSVYTKHQTCTTQCLVGEAELMGQTEIWSKLYTLSKIQSRPYMSHVLGLSRITTFSR